MHNKAIENNKEIGKMKNFMKNMFNHFRVMFIEDGDVLSDERLVKAITLNENLKAFGFCLKPEDIVRVARAKNLDSLFDEFKSLQSEIKAEPMYPDFPSQVLSMDEAEFRFHQLVHYFSTYGIEYLFGVDVQKGWLPDVESTEKTVQDVTLLEAKTIEIADKSNLYILPCKRILTKKERISQMEENILCEALKHVEPSALDFEIPFKENLGIVACLIIDNTDSKTAKKLLARLCQHTGDVWRCLSAYLAAKKYHLTTSQKKLFVKLFESYSVADFQSNLIISNAKAEKVIRQLEFLSFNRFSRSPEHKEAVRKLRNGELRSWQGQVDFLLSSDGEKALDFIAQRPGMLVRLTARLMRLGYKSDDIAEKLVKNAGALSMQTLITILNHFGKASIIAERDDAEEIYKVMHQALNEKMKTIETPFKGKKVFIDEGDFSLEFSHIEKKSEEGGYVRSGLAYKMPKEANKVRFFVYWNDKERIDIDLHATACGKNEEYIHVGWNGEYNFANIVHSGDITHSDAAEYIDIDMNKTDAVNVNFAVDLYSGARYFENIEECFVGLTAVGRSGKDVVLYDPKNCFFSHNLKSKAVCLNYGRLDVVNRVLIVSGKPIKDSYFNNTPVEYSRYTLEEYLENLLAAQEAKEVSREEADVVLVMGKPNAENEVSILDNDFFRD